MLIQVSVSMVDMFIIHQAGMTGVCNETDIDVNHCKVTLTYFIIQKLHTIVFLYLDRHRI